MTYCHSSLSVSHILLTLFAFCHSQWQILTKFVVKIVVPTLKGVTFMVKTAKIEIESIIETYKLWPI